MENSRMHYSSKDLCLFEAVQNEAKLVKIGSMVSSTSGSEHEPLLPRQIERHRHARAMVI